MNEENLFMLLIDPNPRIHPLPETITSTFQELFFFFHTFEDGKSIKISNQYSEYA